MVLGVEVNNVACNGVVFIDFTCVCEACLDLNLFRNYILTEILKKDVYLFTIVFRMKTSPNSKQTIVLAFRDNILDLSKSNNQ